MRRALSHAAPLTDASLITSRHYPRLRDIGADFAIWGLGVEIKTIATRHCRFNAACERNRERLAIVKIQRTRQWYFRPLMRIVHRATSRQLLAKDEFPRVLAEEGR